MTRLFGIELMVLFVSIHAASAQGGDSSRPDGLENIAAGKSYTPEPSPNYQFCTDEGDKTQLTDGKYTEGYFWTQKSTVGWGHSSHATVTIDLGSVQPIRGVSYNTAAGVAGVAWPTSILVLASDDGKTYYLQGDLVELDAIHGQPPAEGYGVHRFWTDQLTSHGRFVKVVAAAAGAYLFVDEIEVYRGQDAWVGQPQNGRQIDNVNQYLHGQDTTIGVRRRLRSDVKTMRDTVKDLDSREALERELSSIDSEIPHVVIDKPEEFRTVFPLHPLHARIFAVQAAAWRARKLADAASPLVVWQKPVWDMLSPFESPRPGGVKIDVAMMQNEWRSAAFNLSNIGDAAVTVQLAIDGLPGGPNPKYISVHEVPFTDTKSGVPVAAALPLAEKQDAHYVVRIEPGMTRQIWLTFHSRDISSGTYEGKITVEPGATSVPLSLKVYPIAFPDQPALHLGGWDYMNDDRHYEVTPENREAFLKCMREHYVDAPWATSSVMPFGKFNAEGKMVEPPATAAFEKWRQRWPDARMFLVFSNVGPKFAGFDMGTPAFQQAVAEWINWWAAKLAEWNIRPEQLGLLLLDEPNNLEQDKIIVEYAKVIRLAQPKVLVWEDPIWAEPWKANPQMFALSNALCPNLPMWISHGKRFADFYLQQCATGKELWFYSCSGPGKLLDPYTYHRLQQWFCWKFNAKGAGFWAFGDSNGASSWNEYLSQVGAYTPIFLDTKTVADGKHMEAIREGMEDYEYLRILRDRIAELEKKGVQNDAVRTAKTLLETAADRVIETLKPRASQMWNAEHDRTVADRVRIEVLEALTALRE